jgi:hypothetical protein
VVGQANDEFEGISKGDGHGITEVLWKQLHERTEENHIKP